MVDRCICYSKSFTELKDAAARSRVSCVTALQMSVEFGLRCGLCKPYVQRMLETGQTVFAPMTASVHPLELLGGDEIGDRG